VRLAAARRMPKDELGWAIRDKSWRVRQGATERLGPTNKPEVER
jgi:hypothetical protein